MTQSVIVQEVARRLHQSLNIDEALYRVLSYLEAFFPLDNLHLAVFNSAAETVRYLASATRDGGILIDETIPLSKEASMEGRMMIPDKVLLLNNPLEKKLIQEIVDANMTTETGESVYNPGSVFSAMTLVLDIGFPLKGMCTMVAGGKDKYTKELQQQFKLLEAPMTNAILNLLKYREIVGRNEVLNQVNNDLRRRVGHLDIMNIIGAEKGLKPVMSKVSKVASKDTPVLVTGETGTGKEVIAHAIHRLSSRKNGPMVCINCGAIPPALIDSELFGHEKGAFTGAINKKRGYFEQASEGTIFLDEVAELPLQAQVRLLRVIQEKTLYRVGGTKAISVDVRIIAATHKNLEELILQNLFREDLWFRLNVFPIKIPALRERVSDIPDLVNFFINKKALEMHLPYKPVLGRYALPRLISYLWPGNIRELENMVERSLITSSGEPLEFPELSNYPIPEITVSDEREKVEPLDEVIIGHIKKALRISGNKISGKGSASELLRINPSTLRGKMKKYKISF